MTALSCSNCGKVIGETNADFKLADIQVQSCGSQACVEIVSEKAKAIFDNLYQDKSFEERMNMLVVGSNL